MPVTLATDDLSGPIDHVIASANAGVPVQPRAAQGAMQTGLPAPQVAQAPLQMPPDLFAPPPQAVSAAPAASGGPQSGGGKLTEQAAAAYFVGKGLTPEQAQGVARRLMQESGGDPNAYNATGGGIGAYGIAQDRGSRQAKMLQMFGPTPSAKDQLDFAWHELNTSEKDSLDRIKAAKTTDEAYSAFTRGFERPGPSLSQQWSTMTPEEQGLLNKRNAATEDATQGLSALMQDYARAAAQATPGSKQRDALIAKYRENLQQMQQEWRQKVASPPVEKPVDALQNFGSAATVIALFAGLLSRRHVTSALNAAGDAMHAINTNNHEQFEKSYETWKTQTQLGLQMIGMENEDIRSLLEDQKMSIDQKNARLGTLAAEMGFVQHLGDMQTANIDTGLAFMQRRQALAQQMQTHADAIQMHYDSMQQMHEDRMAALQARTGGAGGAGGNAILDHNALGEMADQYLAGDKSVLTGLGYGNIGAQNRAALRTEIQKRATALGMTGRDIATALAEYSGLTAGERSLGTRTAQMGMAVDEAKQLIPQVLETSAKVDRTEYPTINKLILAGEQGTGDPSVVKLGIAINSFINVYARAISPTGVPTVSDKDHARELLEASWSQGQIQAGMDQITKELEAGARAPRDVTQEFRERGSTQVSQPQIGNLSASPSAPTGPAAPKPGDVMEGYRFKGGDPSDRNNWEKQ